MGIYDCIDDFTIDDQIMDLFIDQLHQFAEEDEEETSCTTSDFLLFQ